MKINIRLFTVGLLISLGCFTVSAPASCLPCPDCYDGCWPDCEWYCGGSEYCCSHLHWDPPYWLDTWSCCDSTDPHEERCCSAEGDFNQGCKECCEDSHCGNLDCISCNMYGNCQCNITINSVSSDSSSCVDCDITFTASISGNCDCISWSGGGTPSGQNGGCSFTTKWNSIGNKTVAATADCGDSSKEKQVTIGEIEAISANADNAPSCKINYEANPSVSLVNFSAPGTTDSKNNVSGSFYFTYNQAACAYGSNPILVTYNCCSEECTVTKTYKQLDAMEVVGAYFQVEGVGQRAYNHLVREHYTSHVYSISYSGKTINTISSTALINFGADENYICLWHEQHKYSWSGGGTSWVSMADSGGLPPGKACATAIWATPTGLKGIAKCAGLLWNYGGGFTPAIITNAEVDRSMPE